jgi:dTDP-4-amino-4,6-dideoxygalactose transaminase
LAIPVANPKAQVQSIKQELVDAVTQVFDNCQFILGANVKALEQEIPAMCEAKYGIGVNSGTDAIVISLAAAGVGPGDEVITTPYTFVATTEAIIIVGATPVFVDIDPKTFNLDPAKIAAAITDKTKAILPVHLYGQCCAIDEIMQLANEKGLKVVFDGAQAIGSKYKGTAIGKYGDAATLSFFPTKNLGGCGDGGMVLTNDPDVAERARELRVHGMDETYSYRRIGYCSRLDELQAAALMVKLRYIEKWNEARRANAAYYIEMFKDLPLTAPVPLEENYHTYHQFTLRYEKRDQLKAGLAERGVGSAVYYPSPLHLQRAYEYLGYKEGDFPESELAALQVLSLPVYPELSEEDRNTVAGAVVDTVKSIA